MLYPIFNAFRNMNVVFVVRFVGLLAVLMAGRYYYTDLLV